MNVNLGPDAAARAVDFLEKLRPGGPWVLTAIKPDGPTETITARNADAVRKFVRANDGKRNLYYSVNPTRRAMTRKASKADIAAIEYLLADLDPRDDETPEAAKARYLAALEAHRPIPTAIIDSGNGIQALWRLAEPIRLPEPVLTDDGRRALSPEATAIIADVEARMAALMVRLGSVAGTQNIDRILRLPGTTNLPNAKKAKAGRVKCPTKVTHFNGATCTPDGFPEPEPEAMASEPCADSIDALPVAKRIKNLIRGIDDPEHPYDSRSEAVFAVILAMLGGGCTDDQIEAVFLDRSFPISAHVLEQSQSAQYLMPPTSVGILDRGTYSNVEQESRSLVQNSIGPLAGRIEAAMHRALLTDISRRTLYIEHDLDGLLRGDVKSRFDAYRLARECGVYSPNDIRRKENEPPIPNGDTYNQPANWMPLGAPAVPGGTP